MSYNKIIHIFDDDKFIDPSIKLFEETIPNQSIYYVLTKQDGEFKFVSSKEAIKVVIESKYDLNKFIDEISSLKPSIVFFHSLNENKVCIINKLPVKVVKVWFVWGYDLYGANEILKKGLYSKETIRLLNQSISLKNKLKQKLVFNNLMFNLFLKSYKRQIWLPDFLKKVLINNYNTEYFKATVGVDVVVPVLPTEYSIIKKLGVEAQYAPFAYGCLEDLLGNKIDESVQHAQNILVGNSGDPTNNHINVFKKLSNKNLKDRKVFVPLSYSGNDNYINKVLDRGKHYLGDNFKPITNFMSLQEYNEILLSCGFVIFNHVRQQGLGNLIVMGYLGAKLYINPKSPTYQFFREIGVNVSKVDELGYESFSHLNDQQYYKNRTVLRGVYCKESVHHKIKSLFLIVKSYKK